jgi:hypothetical protein
MTAINRILDIVESNKRYQYWLFFAVLVCLSSLMVYFYNPLQPGHDFFFHFRRFEVLTDAIRNGYFPSYIDYQAIDGYGYLTKVFYPDLVLAPFAFIGTYTSSVLAYQLMIWFMTILCGRYAYKAIDLVYKNRFAAFTGAILYTFAFYRLLDLYQRAALGEALSFTFLPLVFIGMYSIIKGDCKKWYNLALGFIFLIFTHVISTALAATICFIIALCYNKTFRKEPKRFLYILLSALVTILVTAYYLFPFIEQLWSGAFYYQTHQLIGFYDSGFKLNWIIWGLFGGIVQPRQIMTPGTGILLTLALCTRIFIREKSGLLKSADIMAIVGIIFILLSTDFLSILWSVFPLSLFKFIQFPWRLYEFSTFFFAIAGGYYISLLVKSRKRVIICSAMLCIATVFMMVSDGKLYQTARSSRSINEVANYENQYHLGGCEYLPSKIPSLEYLHTRGTNTIEHNNATTVVHGQRLENGILGINTEIIQSDVLELPLIYYKGYKASLNNNEISVSESKNGLVEIPVGHSGIIYVWYAGTIIQTISYYITILALAALCAYILSVKFKNKKSKNESV